MAGLATKNRFPLASYTIWRRLGSPVGVSTAATESLRRKVERGRFWTTPAWIVKERGAEWERVPLVACADIVNCPVAAFGDAPIITEAASPELTENGLAGLLVTPAGTPERVTCTLPEKPFKPFTATLTGTLELPCAMLTVLVENPIVKSGCGGGG